MKGRDGEKDGDGALEENERKRPRGAGAPESKNQQRPTEDGPLWGLAAQRWHSVGGGAG